MTYGPVLVAKLLRSSVLFGRDGVDDLSNDLFCAPLVLGKNEKLRRAHFVGRVWGRVFRVSNKGLGAT